MMSPGGSGSGVISIQNLSSNMASNDMQTSHQQYNGDLIEQLLRISQGQASGCLQLQSGAITWQLHFSQGAITYVSDSISAWDRLERLLRFLGCQPLQQAVDAHARSPHSFTENLDQLKSVEPSQQAINWLLQQQYISSQQSANLLQAWMQPGQVWSEDPSYQAIHWLVTEGILPQDKVGFLIELTIRETLEILLLTQISETSFLLQDRLSGLPRYTHQSVETSIDSSLQRLKRWQTLMPHIWSPYQRPYFFSQSDKAQQLSPELKQRLGSMLRGFSLRHLASMLRKDDFQLAQSLLVYVQQGIVFLREPQAPMDLLPRIPDPQQVSIPESLAKRAAMAQAVSSKEVEQESTTQRIELERAEASESRTGSTFSDRFKIACVDDSLAMLNEITRLLGDEQFSVTAINNPVRALMQIVRVQPSLVLLDVGMPGMDGYELCRLLRNHPSFEKTPVIMVTGHTGIIDRARAKLVGATDYLTKPFTKDGLLKMVSKHLAVAV